MASDKPRSRFVQWIWVFLQFVIVTVVLSAGGGIWYWLALQAPLPVQVERPEKVLNVGVFVTEKVDLEEILIAYGTARADRDTTISAQVSGQVMSITPELKEGNLISKKSTADDENPLVVIDPESYQQRVDSAQNRLNESKADLNLLDEQKANVQKLLKQATDDLDQYRVEYERTKKLVADQIKTDEDLNRAELELKRYETSQLQFQNELALFTSKKEQWDKKQLSLKTELEVARLELKRTNVGIPFSGRTQEVHVEIGQYVRTGDKLFRIIDTSRVEIPLSLSQNDYLKIASLIERGKYPLVQFAEHENAEPKWAGIVVRAAPTIDLATRSIVVYAEVDNSNQTVPLLPGTFVQARITGPIWSNVIAIPRDALVGNTVFLRNGEQANSRQITCTQSIQGLSLIEGLEPGVEVILTSLDILGDGSKVKVTAKRDLKAEIADEKLPVARISTKTAANTED